MASDLPSPTEPGPAGTFRMRTERSAVGLERLGLWVDEIAARLTLGVAVEYALRLCLEEAVANVVMHGVPVPGTDANWIALAVEPVADRLRLTVTDRCAAFDPRSAPEPDIAGSDDRVGGLGIHLMRRYARDVFYAREGPENHLTMTIPA